MQTNNFKSVVKKFNELTLYELYEIIQLRNEIFIVEQNCPYQDLDNKDFKATHILVYLDGKLVAYSRIFDVGITFKEASIGRVITHKKVRSSGIGKLLMEKSIETIYELYGKQNIRIGAQYYAIPFYKKFNFVTEGEVYLEDGIKHIEMIKHAK